MSAVPLERCAGAGLTAGEQGLQPLGDAGRRKARRASAENRAGE